MFRLALAITAGAIFTAIIAFCADAVAADLLRVFPFLDLMLAFPYGICGGLIAARLVPGKEIRAGLGVGLLTVFVGVLSYRMNSGGRAGWLWVSLTASLAGGAVFGSHLWSMRVAKRLAEKRSVKVRKVRSRAAS
jgi:ABC-type multidrug transport system permease subunit